MRAVINNPVQNFAARVTFTRVLLGATLVVHTAVIGTTGTLLILGLVVPIATVIAIGTLTVLAVLSIGMGARYRSIALRPASWPSRSVVTSLLEGAACSLAVGAAFTFGVAGTVAICAAVVGIHVGLAVAASRALTRPVPPELGMLDHEVVVKIRLPQHLTQPRWASPDMAKLTSTEVAIVIRTGVAGAAHATIPLAEINAIGLRTAGAPDSPWLKLPDGTDLPTAPGEIVVICHGGQQQVLPVYDGAAFAEVVRVRAERVSGHPIPSA